MSNLFLSVIISLAHAGSGIPPAATDASPISTGRLAVVPLSAAQWIDQSNRAIRSGECYEAVKAATCEIPDLMIRTRGWQTSDQHYRGLLECNGGDTIYLTTTPEYEEEILNEGEFFCRDANAVYVSMPALPPENNE